MDAFTEFTVVVNEEEQYSLWPVGLQIPLGWRSEGTTGSEAHCLARVEQIWPDIRPKSLRDSIARRRAEESVR
jgi:MbtH protein